MGLTHFAVASGTEAAVDQLVNTMKAAGITLLVGPRCSGDGYYEAVILDPEGNRVALMA